MCVMPARTAPSTFSLSPPIGSTRPDSVISPVIATSWRAGRPESADTIAVAIAMPADGPSFGIAPAGHVDVHVALEHAVVDRQPVGVRPRERPRGARRLLHHVAELAGEDELALAAHRRRLDEHDVAARRRVVHAGRDADLVLAVRLLGMHARSAEQRSNVRAIERRALDLACRDPARDLARERRARARAGARRPRACSCVITSRIASSVSASCSAREAVRVELARHQVLLRDRELLALGVAGEVDDLHAIEQRARDVLDEVRGRDEHHLGQIERHAEVVIGERVVLRRVEDLEQRGRGIAVIRAAELVDLVEQEHRVLAAGLLHALEDAAGQRADVRAAMAADVGLVARAAERDRGRTCAPSRARSTSRSTSCRRPADRRTAGCGPSSPCPSTAGRRGWRQERPVAGSEVDADRVVDPIGDDDVGKAVAVHVTAPSPRRCRHLPGAGRKATVVWLNAVVSR